MRGKPFKKGNPGKPKGARNKTGCDLRALISGFLEDNFAKVASDFDKLQPKDRAKLYIDLLQYSLPKLQAISNSFEGMSDEQIDRLYTSITEKLISNDD